MENNQWQLLRPQTSGHTDLLAKFEANHKIFLHRHLGLTNTVVLQGEHRMYEPDGSLKEARPIGSYTSTVPGEPQRERTAAEDAIVFYKVRGKDGALFEILNDMLTVIGTLAVEDFVQGFEEQKRGRH